LSVSEQIPAAIDPMICSSAPISIAP
jgi:hypothetical protein